jgi:DNA-binding PucR family transcriptional regulator
VETAGMARVPTHRIESLLRDDDMESAWMLRSDVELGVVSCFGEQIPGLRASVEHFRVRAGISPVFTDFGNAPHAVRLARTALAAAPKGRVLYFADSAIGTMAAGAPDVASELTSIVLYGLLEMPKQERDVILDTVRTWFGASGSVAETARSMFVHPNTVRNRLRRLEALTMRSLSNPRQAAEIYLAVVTLSQ